MEEEIFYWLSIGDIQTVAREILDRELSEEELAQVKELAPERVNWFDAIEAAIQESVERQDS